ncbi:MAG: response regulator [Caulobacterales bacterium]|nr:response regulator [Caulobacterales bacterium]
MADAVVQINRDGIVEAASRAVDVLFGWRPDELIGRPIAVLMGAPEAQAHQSFVDRYLETGQSGILNAAPRTLIGRHRSGGKVVFELTIGEAWVAGERKFIGVCRDASARVALEDERRDAVEALRTKILELERARTELMAEQLKTRDRANAAVELSKREAVAKDNAVAARQVLSMAVNLADVHVWELNYRTRTLQKWGAEDTLFERPMSFRDLVQDPFATIHPDDRDEVILAWKRYLETGRPETLEYRINRRDGQEIWASSTTELLKDDAGRPHRLVGALQNITRRKQADRSLIHALEQAEAATRAKSEFLANMSHEIRTPLNGVMGVATALSRTPLSPAQAEMVGLIETSGQTLEALLADVLDLARIESGRLELKPETFDLATCLKSAASLFQPGARDKGLDFTLSLGAGMDGDFVGDVTRIRQIVSNLLSNALKFTSRGAIALEAVLDDDGAVSITVRDSGIGFGADVKDRLFERFEQADGSITRRFGGTGLGLAISRVLAEAMGGRLEAHSEPGVGSAFTLSVRLERSAERPAPPAPRAVVTRPDGRSARVLLAEDHPINRKVVELLLDGAGVDLTCVENGAEAVEAAAQEVYDLILMDMQMPIMDGLTAIRAIRARESASGRPAVQISTLSANAMPQHVAASLDAGADGHICKPVDMAELFATIERAVAMRDGVDKVSLCI